MDLKPRETERERPPSETAREHVPGTFVRSTAAPAREPVGAER